MRDFYWPVLETVSYFLDNGSEVFAYSMDKSIAFDLCQFSVLFCKMFRNLSLVFLRLIIYMNIHQFTNVRWGSEISSSINIENGVGQAKMFAGFAYCYYCYDLFLLLKNSGFGSCVSSVFAGAFGYSDDDNFFAPSLLSLQELLKTAESYCTEHVQNMDSSSRLILIHASQRLNVLRG